MLLDLETVLSAALPLITQSVLSEINDTDSAMHLPPGLIGDCIADKAYSLAETILEKETPTVAFVCGRYLGQLEERWGYNPGLVFYHAGLTREQRSRAVYLFVMSLWGHGIGLADEFEQELARAADILCKSIVKDFCQLSCELGADEHETWTSVFVDKYLVLR